MSSKGNEDQDPYKQLRLPPPPPCPRPRGKAALKKTVSAPQAALTRLLGGHQHAGEEEDGGDRVAKKKIKKKRHVEVGEDVLLEIETTQTDSDMGDLINFDADDGASPSASPSASISSRSPSIRSASVLERPSPQLRRLPPPPPERVRLATVTGVSTEKSSGPSAKIRPTPPPKPSYFTSPTHQEQESESASSVPVSDTNGVHKKSGTDARPQPKPQDSEPSPYLVFIPKHKRRPEPPPRTKPDLKSTSEYSPTTSRSTSTSSHSSITHLRVSETEYATVGVTTNTSQACHPVTFPNPPPREMDYLEREHTRNVFSRLTEMRLKGDLCDVTLIGSSREVRAHKAVLAACSSYFESMFIGEFSEPDGQPILIEEIEDDALEALVNFAYTSQIRLTDRNIYLIFAAAELLQFSGVRGACFKFFKQQMNKSNCIRTWLFGDGHNCTELIDAALRYIERNFLDVVRGREFLSIDQPDVVARLLALEDIAVTSEEQVYEAGLNWLRHDLEGRREGAVEVMKSVRFPSMSRDYLLHITETEDIIKNNSECLQMLIDALESFVSGTITKLRKMLMKKKENESNAYINVKPRNASMAVETAEFCRDNQSLGLRIMGGVDRPFHVFRQGDKPGIFILMVLPNGAADKVGKLKTGDRILKVNNTDVSTATHDQAIRLLKTSPDPLTLLVRHEPAPPGLQELTLVTKPGEGFGLSLSGGVNGYHGNPLDETDEGIFISQIIPGGAAERDGRLMEGTRILQVNSISMLGKTHTEALQVLQGVLDRINLLVCFGYNPAEVASWYREEEQGTVDTMDEFGYIGSESLYNRRPNDDNIETGAGGLLV